MKTCYNLFNEITIDCNGSVCFCCFHLMSKTFLGNIYKDKFDDMWNGELAVNMRKCALNGQYPHCNKVTCSQIIDFSSEKYKIFFDSQNDYKPIMDRYPEKVEFYFGRDCNAKCVFCRDNIITSSQEETEKILSDFEKYFAPIMKDAKIIKINNNGDAFGTQISINVIQMILEKYPKMKFVIMTNGISASEELIKKLDLEDKMEEFDVSINAVSKETHEKIFRVKGWDKLLKNLSYISKLKKEDKINHLHFKFVVCSLNWKEMAAFIKFAEKFGANADFWEVRNYWPDLENKFENLAVHLKSHKDFEAFKKSLVNPIFDKNFVTLSADLIKLRNEALKDYPPSVFSRISSFFKK